VSGHEPERELAVLLRAGRVTLTNNYKNQSIREIFGGSETTLQRQKVRVIWDKPAV
jgi:hypothetical protein